MPEVKQGYVEREYKVSLREFLTWMGVGTSPTQTIRAYFEGDQLRVTARRPYGEDWEVVERQPIHSRPISLERATQEVADVRRWQKHLRKAEEDYEAEKEQANA